MVGDRLEAEPFVVVTSDPEISQRELVHPFIAALEHALSAIVETREASLRTSRAWLLPTRVTVLFRTGFPAFHEAVLRAFATGATDTIAAAVISLYAGLNANTAESAGDTTNHGVMPVSLDFQGDAREVARFVLGPHLRSDDVAHALARVAVTLHSAKARLHQGRKLLEELAGSLEPSLEEHTSELVHLYTDSLHGWQVLA